MKKFRFLYLFLSILIISCSTDEDEITDTPFNPVLELPDNDSDDSDDTEDSNENEDSDAPQNARYSVTFIGEWTQASHPNSFPNNDHFSPSVLLSHCTNMSLFEEDQEATLGIENMAEIGSTTVLISEMQTMIDNEDATAYHIGSSSLPGNGSNEFIVDASQDFYRISYVAMIAPSPDWFVGASNINLFVDDQWIDELEIDVINYDAGTEDGSTFSYDNEETSPKQPISQITQGPLANTPRLGYLRIVKQ